MRFFRSKKKQDVDSIEAVKQFRDPEDLLITFDRLKEFPVGKTVQIIPEKPGAIETTRIRSVGEDLSFRVVMKKGEKWEKHHHDCYETILVYKGTLFDKLNDRKAKRVQILKFPPYTSHYVIAEEDSIFYVEFKNPKQ